MYKPGETIEKTLNDIQRHDLVLPAIQREFVWKPDQIYRLFDSLMQGYPIGTLLYWRINRENSTEFNFYDFVLNYHERDKRHCDVLPQMPNQRITAVLDGQQRLTALNIGLRGSMAWKRPRLWWNNPNAFPERKLHLDLLWAADEDDDSGMQYRFRFLTEEQASATQSKECWFLIGEILAMKNAGPAMTSWLTNRLPAEQIVSAHQTLFDLYNVVREKSLLTYYDEHNQKLDKVLQVFIRMNDGGTPLSYSDLLLSVAVAQWKDHDARVEIHALVDYLNSIGGRFSFSKDLVLKAGLMMSDIRSVGFKVDNFNRENMRIFEKKWANIKRALTLTVQLISGFGFYGWNLTAHNSILPIAYYLYLRNPGSAYLTHSRFEQDRQTIREWLIRSLLKSGIWGSGLDTLLTALRSTITSSTGNSFPVGEIRLEMARRAKSLIFEEEEVEELADMQYGHKLTFSLLSLVFPFIDLRNQFEIDHIFPRARLTERKLRAAGVPDDKIREFALKRDGIANLQLLEGAFNNEKRTMMPSDWLAKSRPDSSSRREYQERYLLGKLPESMVGFGDFFDARRARLKARIEQLLGR